MGTAVQPVADPFADLAAPGASDPFADLAPAATPEDPLAVLHPRPATAADRARAAVPFPAPIVPRAPSDVTQTPMTSDHPPGSGTPEPTTGIGGRILKDVVNPLVEMGGSPLTAAVQNAAWPVGLWQAGSGFAQELGGLIGQTAAEHTLPPDVRAMAEADPSRIQWQDVLTQGLALGALPLLHAAGGLVPDLGAAVPDAFSDLATEMKGTPPADLPDTYLNRRFAERLQQGAVDAGTAEPQGARPPMSPEAQATATFANTMAWPQAEAAPRVASAEGVESAADVVAQDAMRAYYRGLGFARRAAPEGEAAAPSLPPDALTLADAAAGIAGRGPDPFADLAPSPTEGPPEASGTPPEALAAYPEGFAMGGAEGRLPAVPPELSLRGNALSPGIAVTPDVENFLGGQPLEREPPPATGPELATGGPSYLEGTPRALRPDEPLLNPRTFDPSSATQGALTAAVRDLQAQGVTKRVVTVAEQMQQAQLLGKETLRDLGIDPLDLDLQKVKAMSGPQILAVKQAATTAMDQLVGISKELERPDLPETERPALQALYDRTKQGRDALLQGVMLASSERGRDLNFLKQVALRSLDPDVWVHQARRLSGDAPLADALIAKIRDLARAAAEACA